MGGADALQGKTPPFDPQGRGFDMDTALKFGMQPSTEPGKNFGHFGSVVPTTAGQRKTFGLPADSFMILKGRKHESFDKAVLGEKRRGFTVKQFGDRFFSVPAPRIGDVLNE